MQADARAAHECALANSSPAIDPYISPTHNTVSKIMGVPQTLKKLGPLCRESNLYDVARGRIVGFDGHVLLHHFVYAAASDIVHRNDFRPLAKMVRQRCQVIRGHGVTPLVVFDGGRLPIKQQTNEARARARAQAYARVQFELDPSPQALAAAAKLTDEAVREVISELSEHGIAHVVAPYEADAQLAWMSDQGLIWAAATVDNDFVMHGVKRIRGNLGISSIMGGTFPYRDNGRSHHGGGILWGYSTVLILAVRHRIRAEPLSQGLQGGQLSGRVGPRGGTLRYSSRAAAGGLRGNRAKLLLLFFGRGY